MRGFLFLLLLALATGASAQTVTLSGTVRDSLGQPLAGMPVQVLANSGVNPRVVIDEVVTDARGAYDFGFDRLGIHLLRVLQDTTSAFNPEAPFLVDRAEAVVADLVLAPAVRPGRFPVVLQMDYADPDSRPARLARVFGYAQPVSDEPLAAAGMEAAALASGLKAALYSGGISPEQARTALEQIPAESPFWLASGDFYLLLRTVDATGTPEAYANEMEAYVFGQPDPLSVMGLTYEAAGKARRAGDEARIERYLSFVRENAPDSYWGSRTLAEYALDRAVQPAQLIPDFAFPRLGGEGFITPEAMEGTVYLIDFWAVWCGPCVRERSELQDLYAIHHERGLEIVSVSFDFAPEDVDLERWPMPWHHAYMKPDEPETLAVMETFALGALPKLVLVGKDGRVIAGGAELRPSAVGNILPNILTGLR